MPPNILPSGPLTAHPTSEPYRQPNVRVQVYMKAEWEDDWTYVPYMMACSAKVGVLPERSTADLIFRHGRLQSEGVYLWKTYPPYENHDWFVCLVAAIENETRYPFWCGIIPAEHLLVHATRKDDSNEPIMSGDENVQAVGFEYLLERRRINGAISTDGAGTRTRFQWQPPFNARSRFGADWPGNRTENVVDWPQEGEGPPGSTTYGFGNALNAYGLPYQWSLRNITEYLLFWSNPRDANDYPIYREPHFHLAGVQEPGYDIIDYIDRQYPVLSQENRNIWEMLRELFNRSRGIALSLVWSTMASENAGCQMPSGNIEVRLSSMSNVLSSVGGVSFPPNPWTETISVDGGLNVVEPKITIDSFGTFDKINVTGERVISCFSAAPPPLGLYEGEPEAPDPDGPWFADLDKAWDVPTEVDFKAEAGSELVAPDDARKLPKYSRVYRAFKLPDDFGWVIPLPDDDGEESRQHVLNPAFNDDGEVQLDTLSPSMQGMHHILDWVPLRNPGDVLAEMTEPSLLKPTAYLQGVEPKEPGEEEGGTAGWRGTGHWYQADNLEEGIRGTVGGNAPVTPADRGALITVTFTPGQILAKTHFDADDEGTEGGAVPEFAWYINQTRYKDAEGKEARNLGMVVTMAVETDTRARVRVTTGARPLNGPNDPRFTSRELTIRVPDVQVWVVAPGTVIGLTNEGELQHFSGSRIVRDDTDELRRVAALAKVIYGRRRAALALTYRGLVCNHPPGTMIEAVKILQKPQVIGTVVTSTYWDCLKMQTAIKTGFLQLDSRRIS